MEGALVSVDSMGDIEVTVKTRKRAHEALEIVLQVSCDLFCFSFELRPEGRELDELLPQGLLGIPAGLFPFLELVFVEFGEQRQDFLLHADDLKET